MGLCFVVVRVIIQEDSSDDDRLLEAEVNVMALLIVFVVEAETVDL